jgi:DNA-nicking Smr family endonuclease
MSQVPIDSEFDLHAFAPADIPDAVDAYLTAAHEAGLTDVRVIHGRGRGIQRGIVQALLDKHPLVESFSDDTTSHLGATFVHLASRLP